MQGDEGTPLLKTSQFTQNSSSTTKRLVFTWQEPTLWLPFLKVTTRETHILETSVISTHAKLALYKVDTVQSSYQVP